MPATPGATAQGRIATTVDTLVVLMGVGTLPRITARLLAAGRGADTPAAAIHRGTTQAEETVVGTLGDIAARAARLQAPAVIVIGEAVAFRSLLARSLLDAVALDQR